MISEIFNSSNSVMGAIIYLAVKWTIYYSYRLRVLVNQFAQLGRPDTVGFLFDNGLLLINYFITNN